MMRVIRRILIAWALLALAGVCAVALYDWSVSGDIYTWTPPGWEGTSAKERGLAKAFGDPVPRTFQKVNLGTISERLEDSYQRVSWRRVANLPAGSKVSGHFKTRHLAWCVVLGIAFLFLGVTAMAIGGRRGRA